ncbi:MAG TPA: sigma-70 family RNA polymerase sigma factor [Candidatus Limnocylindrales bacterium]|nr:sigma-70 family RNA polymerase sigma factor [Candidatus Limnocylindrales bacterium]
MTGLALESAAIASAVERAVDGDEIAFARIVGAYHLDLVRVAYVICGDEGLAEDAAQAAWWIAWRKLPALRDPDRLKPWLVAVAANEARKVVRREHRHGVVELRVAADPPTDADPSVAIDQVDLANALGRLKPEDRALVAMRYAADLDSFALAPILGLSPSGVRSRLSRLLDRLRKEFGDD